MDLIQKIHLFGIIQYLKTTESNVIARSSNGINWSTVFSPDTPSMTSNPEPFTYATDDYIFLYMLTTCTLKMKPMYIQMMV